jgi:hypothetical protein
LAIRFEKKKEKLKKSNPFCSDPLHWFREGSEKDFDE